MIDSNGSGEATSLQTLKQVAEAQQQAANLLDQATQETASENSGQSVPKSQTAGSNVDTTA